MFTLWVNQQGNHIDIDLGEGIKKEAKQSGGVEYSYFSGSKGAENLYNTPEYLKPDTEQEWSEFNRSFANQTSGLKSNENKDIIIITSRSHYLLNADGYMSGTVLSKTKIDDYFKMGGFIDDYRNTEEFSKANDRYGVRQRNHNSGSDTFEDQYRNSEFFGMDEFSGEGSNTARYTVRSKEDYKNAIKESWRKLSKKIKK